MLPARYNDTEMSENNPYLPPPTFEFLVLSLRFQTESHLGVQQWTEEKPEVNLPAARHSIDMLAMIQDKTRNNLTMEEQRLIENSLTELRFRYIQAFETAQKQKAEADAAGAAAAQAEPAGESQSND
jgi:hypothetical protein